MKQPDHIRDRLYPNSSVETPDHKRRRVLRLGIAALAAASLPRQTLAASPTAAQAERALAFYNTHTGERLKTTYWEQGQYIGEALSEINHVLRDHLANETREIDPKMLDLLFAIRSQMHSSETFHVISGYRSNKTNAYLRAHSSGVADNSLHTVGKAIDIRLPGRDLRSLRKVAVDLKGGGVGFYPKSDFVHVDVGHVRYW
ncbi:MAG: DUF882 domain-containing protein [Candidatus Binatia bacterium]